MELERLLLGQLIAFAVVVFSIDRYPVLTGFLLGCNMTGVLLLIVAP